VSDVLDSLIAMGNSFQIVGAEKPKEHLLKTEISSAGSNTQKNSDWHSEDSAMVGIYIWEMPDFGPL